MDERNLDKVLEFIGQTGQPLRFSVEAGAIRRYADAISDMNPLHTGPEDDKLIAPPGFFGWPVHLTGSMPFYPELRIELISALAESGFASLLDGSLDYVFNGPVRSGDVLDVIMTVEDIALKQGKSGSMVICTLGFSYTRPGGEVAATVRQKIIAR